MPQQPPPFAGLRVLEAACRLKSYSQTGEELGVTHSAVSQTIRRLEMTYGLKLFRRQGMRMMPTDPAIALSRAYAEAARIIDRAAADVSAGAADERLVIAMPPSVAKLWFTGRLQRLQEALPALDVEVRTARDLAGLDADGVDVTLRFGRGEQPGLHVEPLFDEIAFPVASPDFVARHGAIHDARLGELPLILEEPSLWPAWFSAARQPPPQPLRGLAFDDAAMVVEAAAAGLGVALVRRIHADAFLEAGRLVRVSQAALRTPQPCCLVWRADNPRIAAIRRFADWMLAECDRAGLLAAA
ncbi:LysR substrate-binding domain-containing protein [Caulobacter sp. KR2-114]|uniref:LysR substrate-binding domain-containing protein n=1 Tax=Caulobacter sp. KR2-114 TaxID=3400912 RepID=UPI003C00D104